MGVGCASFFQNQRGGGPIEEDDPPGYYQPHGDRLPSQSAESALQPKKKIIILGFTNQTPVPEENVGTMAADELRGQLALTERVIVPEDGNRVLKTDDFVQGDRIKVAQLIQEGRKQGVSLLVVGRISRLVLRQKGEEYGILAKRYSMAAADLEIKLFDVQLGREIMAAVKTGEATEGVFTALESKGLEDAEYRTALTQSAIKEGVAKFVPEIIRSIDKTLWQGRIVKVEGSKYYINSGTATGLVKGDILRVLPVGDDVYDAHSGAYLGRSKGMQKGTLEVVDFIGADGGITQLHSGGNIQEGDMVQLY